MVELNRATDRPEDAEDIPSGTCWTPDRDAAVAYTDNPGFGGRHIVSIEADDSRMLDCRDGYLPLALLMEDDPYEAGELVDQWRANGWLYPWEESRSVKAALDGSGYEWIAYTDDYPQGAETWRRI